MGGILFPSTGLAFYESSCGVKTKICLACFTDANAAEFHPHCFVSMSGRRCSVNETKISKHAQFSTASATRCLNRETFVYGPVTKHSVWHLLGQIEEESLNYSKVTGCRRERFIFRPFGDGVTKCTDKICTIYQILPQ